MSLTLRNNTRYIAQFIVCQGDRIISRLAGLAPGGQIIMPVQTRFEVVASTLIDGNRYTAAPVFVDCSSANAPALLAEIRQMTPAATLEFGVVESFSPNADSMTFQKTCRTPVTFTLMRDGRLLQHVVVSNSFQAVTLQVSGNISVHAVINGITTATTLTSNPAANIVAVEDSSVNEAGFFELAVS
jgi:hypothetical protein